MTWKTILPLLLLAGAGFYGYDLYTSPYFNSPYIKEGEFLVAFKGENSLRGIMTGIDDERQTRKYLSYGAKEVPRWYQSTWSTCRKPESDEATAFENSVDMGPGGRLDAICEINADGDVFVRGWIVSVPDL